MGMNDKRGDDGVTKLGWPQLTQKINTAVFDDISIVRRERLTGQQVVNGFAGAEEIYSFFPKNRRHGGTPYERGRHGCAELKEVFIPT